MTEPTETPEQLAKRAREMIRQMWQEKPQLNQASIELILIAARSHYAWTDRPVSPGML